MKKTLYLMRHGQTLFNVRRKIQGACDSPLTELGINQAKHVSQYFKDIKLDHAYASTSERSSDTLELILEERFAWENNGYKLTLQKHYYYNQELEEYNITSVASGSDSNRVRNCEKK